MEPKSLTDELLNELGEEFTQRLRRGDNPSIKEYTTRFTGDEATEVEDFLDSIAMLEDMKGDDGAVDKKSDTLPDSFGRYTIKRSLGEGGMGAVYLAHDTQLDRKVALKTPKFARNSDPNLMSRFYREARSAATLQHPNICPVYDVGEIDGIHYISMAYIEGRPLSDYIQSRKSPPVASVIKIVRKIAIALHEAHSSGLVHRDLKPANIMIDRRNEPIVMDFGLARQFGDGEDAQTTTQMPTVSAEITPADAKKCEARLTMDGTVVGSPGYMSPEQLFGEHGSIGPASDVYALGVLLFELLTCELPFPGDGTLMSIVNSVISDDPPDASKIRPKLDSRIAAICRKAMSKRIEDRYESMFAFAVALTEVLKSDQEAVGATGFSEVKESSTSPDLVRIREHYNLARSLYQEEQYSAAVSILEKMTTSGESPNQFTKWAAKELPRARAKAEKAATQSSRTAVDESLGDEFWDEDYGEASLPPTRKKSQRGRKRTRSNSTVRRLATSAVVLIVILLVGLQVRRIMRQDRNAVAASEADTTKSDPSPSTVTQPGEPVSEAVTTAEPSGTVPPGRPPRPQGFGQQRRPKDSPNARQAQATYERLWQMDVNQDNKLSRAELTSMRRPKFPFVKRVVENLDRFDMEPKDDALDRFEFQRMMRMLSRFEPGQNRRP